MEVSTIAWAGSIPLRGLCGLDDLVGLETARADVHAPRAPTVVDPHLLEVRVEAAPRRDHRVAPGVSERGALAAAVADLRHAAFEVTRWPASEGPCASRRGPRAFPGRDRRPRTGRAPGPCSRRSGRRTRRGRACRAAPAAR